MNIEQYILQHKRLFAVLIDPEKTATDDSLNLRTEAADLVFIGGSTANRSMTEHLVQRLKDITDKPLVLFPGNPSQLSSLITEAHLHVRR